MRPRLATVGIASVLAAASVAAQPPVFRSDVEVVEIDVSVTRGGRPVQGLTSDDFHVTDNGVPQQVDSATLAQLPLSLTLLLDVSRSVSGQRLGQLVLAGQGLTRALRDGDRAALVTFSHDVSLRLPMTGDMERLRDTLARLQGVGATALRDGVHLAVAMRPRDHTRSLVLLFSDGADTASWLTGDEVLESVRRSGTVIHSVGVAANPFLDRLAEASGGRTWSAGSDRQLDELFTRALEEMRARYLLTYSPQGASRPGWHTIEVRLRSQRGEVTARPGYFVAEAR